MKKFGILFLSMVILLAGCGSSDETAGSDGDMIVVQEKLFIQQINDVYYNVDEYIGKQIKYEGFFDFYYDVENEYFYYYVLRYGPGCCGDDGNVGFEVVWEDGSDDFPEYDEWVEVVGTVETYEEDDYEYVRLKLSSLEVLDERGNDTVDT